MLLVRSVADGSVKYSPKYGRKKRELVIEKTK
jgi:hypothetical protein